MDAQDDLIHRLAARFKVAWKEFRGMAAQDDEGCDDFSWTLNAAALALASVPLAKTPKGKRERIEALRECLRGQPLERLLGVENRRFDGEQLLAFAVLRDALDT